MGHGGPQLFQLGGIGGAHHSPHAGVAVLAGELLPPALAHSAHGPVDGVAIGQGLVLELAGGGVGGLYQHKDALIALLAHIHQGLDAVGAQVAVDGEGVRAEGLEGLLFHGGGAQVGGGVGSHGGADVVALAVGDDEHALALGVGDGLCEGLHTLPAVHLIVGGLGLNRGDHIAQGVDEALVELEQRVRRTLQGLAVLLVTGAADVLRDVAELGVQASHSGVLFLHDLLNQFIHGHKIILSLMNISRGSPRFCDVSGRRRRCGPGRWSKPPCP